MIDNAKLVERLRKRSEQKLFRHDAAVHGYYVDGKDADLDREAASALEAQDDDFKPYIAVNEEAGVTEIIIEDTAYIAEPLFPGVYHWIDKHVAMDDRERIVGMAIWATKPPAQDEGLETTAEDLEPWDFSAAQCVENGRIAMSISVELYQRIRRDIDKLQTALAVAKDAGTRWFNNALAEQERAIKAERELLSRRPPAAEGKGEPPKLRLFDWTCPNCECHTYARIDVRKPDRSFGPGDHVRCVGCKNVYYHPDDNLFDPEKAAEVAAVRESLSDFLHPHMFNSAKLTKVIDGVLVRTAMLRATPPADRDAVIEECAKAILNFDDGGTYTQREATCFERAAAAIRALKAKPVEAKGV